MYRPDGTVVGMSSSSASPASPAGLPGGRAWAALAVLTLPVLLVSIDNTVLGFAVPTLSEDLRPSASQLLWIVDVYSFVLAGLLVTMGVLGDRLGRRRLLLIGSAGFGLASLAAAYAQSAEVLIAARAAMGFAGATLMPATLSLIRNIFVDRRRRRVAIAVWSAAFSGGAALGPILGGWLLEHFWWGSVFLLNLPTMAVLLAIGPWLIPESRDPAPGRFDPLSALYSLLALLPAVYGLKKSVESGISPIATFAFVLGIGFAIVFVRRQRRLDTPMLDVSLFTDRTFSIAVLTNLLSVFVLVGCLFLLTQYLQLVLGLRPMHAGLLLLPGLTAAVVGSLLATRLVRRFAMASLLGVALAVSGLGTLLLAGVSVDTGLVVATVAFGLIGLGVGVAELLTNDAILASVPARRAGAASAVSETAYELGAALGIAVLGSVLAAVYRNGLTEVPGVDAEQLSSAAETLGTAMGLAAELAGPAGVALAQAAAGAFVDGMRLTSVIGAVIMVTAAVVSWRLIRRAALDSGRPESGPGESGSRLDTNTTQ
ncbi:arabinose efflux permease family protein [Actinoalloteichus fjordicus]|uniref:Arabinose efflux permease family protein n=2 Tax=Actinoalloteichus fjordicus TaxID=1612552 RepID=A0AAC9LJ21_9PSEU|nr:arabinose efflux permease family protein [Actinoalloteichus fjordicus]